MVSQIEKGNIIKTTSSMIRYVLYFYPSKDKVYYFRTNLIFKEGFNSSSLSSSQMQFSWSTYSVSEEVLEVKTMLLQLKRVLEKVRILNVFESLIF